MSITTTQLFEGVHLIHGIVGGRPLTLTLLIGSEKSLLMDTGCSSDVESIILPAFQEVGLDPKDLSMILISHCDLDHVGGNHGMKQVSPEALLTCGDADRNQVESPENLFTCRYDAYRSQHNIFYGEDVKNWIRTESGKAQSVELTFRGGERIRLSPNWEVETLHLPGHSRGHLGLLDRRNRALYGADAIHGAVMLTLEGRPAMPPTYLHVDAYLQTIQLIESLDIDSYVGCHWPVLHNHEDIRGFCDETRSYVEQTERLIIDNLYNTPEGMTLLDLCEVVGPQLGSWPVEVNREHAYAFSGHLKRLEGQGRIEVSGQKCPCTHTLKTS